MGKHTPIKLLIIYEEFLNDYLLRILFFIMYDFKFFIIYYISVVSKIITIIKFIFNQN